MAQTSTSSSKQWETVNRVVYPTKDADLTMPLYAVNWHPAHFDASVFDERDSMLSVDLNAITRSDFNRLVAQGIRPAPEEPHGFKINSRDSITLEPCTHISLCTYFNAFPAGYWRHWTRVKHLRFSARVSGVGTLTLFQSTARGLSTPVKTFTIHTESTESASDSTDTSQVIESILSLKGMLDGGYYWLDARADKNSTLTISHALWQVPTTNRRTAHPGTVSVAITTFNRPSYCLNQLRTIAHEEELRKHLDTIYCTDQGTDLVQEQDGFDEVSKDLGKQLTYIRQGNLGGSGGFSRGMYETVRAQKSDYTLLLDDDAISEPESILRAVQFADYTVRPSLIGGGMFHIDHRTVLHVQGERFDPSSMWMYPSRGAEFNHDFHSEPLSESPSLHSVHFSDFNGWWFCLIPTDTIQNIGLGLPVFIKFDDIEYGLRAKEHGIPTISLPGVAVWHMGWHDKDPARGWEEYFQQRNRWICALLHFPNSAKRSAFRMLYEDAHLGMRLLYSGMHLNHMALHDVLRGPEYLIGSLPTKLSEVRKAREGFDDSTTYLSPIELPEPADHFQRDWIPQPARTVTKMGMREVLKALRSRGSGVKDKTPQTSIPARLSIWPAFRHVNSALVTTPDGDSVAWFRRDSKRYRRNMGRCLILALRLMKQWKRLSQEYRQYGIASIKTWETIFSNNQY